VVRSRLLRLLEDSWGADVTLVCAGAGYGKTTLLATWVDGSAAVPSAWLTLGPEDNDPALFAARLCDAMVEGGILADRCGSTINAVVDALRTRPRDRGRAVVVLDDVHLIDEPSVLAAFADIGEVDPDHLRLVLSGRSEPPLPLARLRADRRVVDIRREDLAFDQSEARELLGGANDDLDADLWMARVLAVSEGWAAGLVLAGLTPHSSVPSGSEPRLSPDDLRQINQYIDQVVVSSCEPDVQRFLEATAFLPFLEPDLCDELADRSDGLGILRSLVEANAFTEELAAEAPTFRYHPLLRATLLDRVRRRSGTAVRSAAQRSAAALARHGRAIEAAELAVREGIDEGLEDIVRGACGEAIARGYATTVRRWLLALPPDRLHSQPDLVLLLGRAAGLSGDLVTARAALLQLTRFLQEGGDPDPGVLVGHQFLQVAVRGWGGDLDEVVQGLEALVAGVRAHRTDPTVVMLGLSEESIVAPLAMGYLLQGRLMQAMSTAEQVVTLAEINPPTRHAVLSLGVLSLAAVWAGDSTRAIRELEASEPIMQAWRASASEEIPLLVATAWAGPLERMAGSLERADRLARSAAVPLMRALPTLAAVRVHQREERFDLMGEAVEAANSALSALPEPGWLPTVLSELVEAESSSAPSAPPPLSDQELKVLAGLATGRTRAEVAEAMHYSVNTVKTHAQSAFRKLEVHDLTEAVARARSWGLLPPGGPSNGARQGEFTQG
jgi:ATP/maltotriose-dependent transcriptional regulator MalT